MQGISPDSIVAIALKKGSEENAATHTTGEGVFEYQSTNETDIHNIVLRMECSDYRGDGFGSGADLTTSLVFRTENSSGDELLDLTYGLDILNNDDLLVIIDDDGAENGKNFKGSRHYKAEFSAPIKLNAGDKIVAKFNDDMSTRVTTLNILINGSKN